MNMNVTTDLPFDFCSTCLMHEYEVYTNDLYSGERVCERSLSIHCQHEYICRGLYNTIKGSLEADNDHEEAH
jgi:hypothetical protein